MSTIIGELRPAISPVLLTSSTVTPSTAPVTGERKLEILAEEVARRGLSLGGGYKKHCIDLRFNMKDGKPQGSSTVEYTKIRSAVRRIRDIAKKRRCKEAEQGLKTSRQRIEVLETDLKGVNKVLQEQRGFRRVHVALAAKLPKTERERDNALREVRTYHHHTDCVEYTSFSHYRLETSK